MPIMHLTDAASQFGGTLLNPEGCFSKVCIDSRTISSGDLFVAISGTNFDGHDFIEQIEDLASGLVVEKASLDIDIPQWVVPDTTLALGNLARLRLNNFRGTIIALTGSSGKTSVKQAVAAILSQCFQVHATKGNLNNHFGVPLTLLDMEGDTEVAVIEMGASAVGEIDYLSSIAPPDIALVNNAQAAHIEGFGSREAIAFAKAEIYQNLKADGVAIVNLDQPWVSQWLSIIGDRKHYSFSISDSTAHFHAADITQHDGEKFSFRLCVNGLGSDQLCQMVHLNLPGLHSVSNALAAAACASAAGATIDQVVRGLETLQSVAGRLQYHHLSDHLTVIDDTYNANPDSFKTAIDVLSQASGCKILVMGDMGELGDYAQDMHREVGEYINQSNIDGFYAVGINSVYACDVANGVHYSDKQLLVTALAQQLEQLNSAKATTTVLIKGSRGAAMESVVTRILGMEGSLC
jgi:UDP-N-acetylmuramoyl-tripeptide--D-alanyl-D-alanine ligase